MNYSKTLLWLIIVACFTLGGCETFVMTTQDASSSTQTPTVSTSEITLEELLINNSQFPSGSQINLAPSSGHGYSRVTLDLGPGFQPTKICSGVTLLGVSGSGFCFGSSTFDSIRTQLASQAFRNQGSPQLSQAQETGQFAGQLLPVGNVGGQNYAYRDVPDSSKDDTGSSVPSVSRPTLNCGLSGALSARIADCNITWDGTTLGNSGQGVWKLVTRMGWSGEVWQDQRTGLLWSTPVVLNTAQWCTAAGSNQADGTCNTNTTSYCAEVLSPADGSGQSGVWGVPYSNAKGGLGAATTPSVRWRLPTLSDYLLAQVNGIQFVVPNLAREWTSSLYSADPTRAATVDFGGEGSAYYRHRNNPAITNSVRCVGRGGF